MSACPRSRAWRDNHDSAYQHAAVVDDLVADRLRRGLLVDVTRLYEADPLLPVFVSPMGVVPKSTPGRFRLILDGSCGLADAVNDFCDPRPLGDVCLATFDAVVADILDQREHTPAGVPLLLFSTDLSDAYLSVPVRVDDWFQLAQVWRQRVYWNTACPFGLRASGFWLHCFTAAFDSRIAAIAGRRPHTYVDDSLGIAPAGPPMAALQEAMETVAPSVGFSLSTKGGIAPPSTARSFCGWVFDTVAMTVSLPQHKLAALRALVAAHATRHRILATDLRSVLGKLSAASRGIRCSRPYLSELFHASSSTSGRWVTLCAAARDDLLYWADLLTSFNGTRILRAPAPAATIFSDASTAWGYGFYCPELGVYACGQWSTEPDVAPPTQHINVLEAGVGVAAAAIIGALLPRGSAISLWLDNTVAVGTVKRERGARGPLSNVARALAFLTDTLTITISPSHIQGVRNRVADALSRGVLPPEVVGFRRLSLPPHFLTSIIMSRVPSRALVTLLGSPTAPGAPPSPPAAPGSA